MILLSISLLAIVAAFFVYRKKPLQFILRAAAVVLIYLLISNYMLRINIGASPQVPTVLIDHSASMEHNLPRIIETASQLDFPHQSFFFQESLITENKPDRLGSYTNITRALRESDRLHSSAIILITDGNHNSGVSPLTILKDMMTPVYVCGAGADKIRDVAVIDAETPAYAYLGDSIQIDVVVESSGFPSGEAQVNIDLSSGKNVAAQTVLLSESRARRSLKFKYITDVIGELHIEANVLPVPGEISYDNNKYSVSLNVIRDKIKVLYYTDHISFNTKFLRQQLKQDDNLSVSSFARRGAGKFLNIEQTTEITGLPDPATYDVIILDNVNIGRPPWSNMPEHVKQGKGLILIGAIEGINENWQRVLPINTTGGVIAGTHRVLVKEPFSVLIDEEYPPLRMIGRAVGSKEDAIIVAYAGNLPVIGYRREGQGVVYQISIIDLATWDFVQRGIKGRDLLGRFIGDIIRFLSHFGQHDRLVLAAQMEDYAIGETVNLTLQSYDRNLRRTGGGDFFLITEDANIPFYETKHGSYETSVIFENPGKHQLAAQGNLNGETLTSNKIEVNITSRPIETEQRLNLNLLERIAAGTNGKFFLLEELENIVPPQSGRQKVSKVINFNSPLTYLLVFLMLAIDWVLRRRRGIT
ncbi:MAG: hypothetical protein OEV79_00465 [candidate division WOR-3 bacterium]|nr:hypothetical protein [candidate division WOR-3 bacterium]